MSDISESMPRMSETPGRLHPRSAPMGGGKLEENPVAFKTVLFGYVTLVIPCSA